MGVCDIKFMDSIDKEPFRVQDIFYAIVHQEIWGLEWNFLG